ncbi:MAG: nitroreductase family protein [Fibrobacter sp.]|nr:nitroreductase family protein [Fibrobacter sp.]
MEFSKVVTERFACKKFDAAKSVEIEKINAVLEMGRQAPTAKNLQEQHIYVLRSNEALSKMDEVTPCRYGAPIALVVAFDKNNVYTYPGGQRDSGIEDASIVATHLMLAAKDQGLDSCWVNNFDPQKLKDLLGLPKQEEILMILSVGYASVDAPRPLNHGKRKPLEETVSYL